MKRKLVSVGGATVAALLLVMIAYNIYNKPHIDVQSEKAAYRLTVDEMLRAYEQNEESARGQYSGKVIELIGDFHELNEGRHEQQYIVLNGREGLVNCEMEMNVTQETADLKQSERIVIKGICIGYDSLLGELQFKKCRIVSI